MTVFEFQSIVLDSCHPAQCPRFRMFMCVRERERDKERVRELWFSLSLALLHRQKDLQAKKTDGRMQYRVGGEKRERVEVFMVSLDVFHRPCVSGGEWECVCASMLLMDC